MAEPTVATLSVKVDGHEKRLDKHGKLLDMLRNRLPNWAVFLFAVLTALIGAYTTALIGVLI